MLDETHCDAVMIGRGVLGNPWLIRQCIDYLDYGVEPEEPSIKERIEMMKKHTDMLSSLKGKEYAIKKMRSQYSHYIKGMPKNIEIKKQMFQINDRDELFELFDNYLKFLEK